MIKCKEDLINTYIENDFGELRDLYLDACLRCGLSVNKACEYAISNIIFVKSNEGLCGNVDHATNLSYINKSFGKMKKLTLSDLKPKRTRTEYEKVTESIFDLRDEFERGELYCKFEHAREYTQITNAQTLSQALHRGYCYRLVEKEIDWKLLLRETIEKSSGRNIGDGSVMVGTSDLTDEEFLMLCHEISEVTNKPRRPSR